MDDGFPPLQVVSPSVASCVPGGSVFSDSLPGSFAPGSFAPGSFVPDGYVAGGYVAGGYVAGAFVPGGFVLGSVAGITCVIVTHDRPDLLRRCLAGVFSQQCEPGQILVVDNASGAETAAVIAEFDGVDTLRLPENTGGAGGFRAGIAAALEAGSEFVWLMDDDGCAADPDCLQLLVGDAWASGADIAAPLVVDDADPDRLAFAIRIRGRTLFRTAEVLSVGVVEGFAHLFNGALIRASLFRRIGLPDSRFVVRGYEVDFLYRALAGGATVRLSPQARFLHPGSSREVHPILGGRFYAVVPITAGKRYFLARNRAFIFSRHRHWVFLVADVVRYGLFYLCGPRFRPGDFRLWLGASLDGLRGRFDLSAAGGDADGHR